MDLELCVCVFAAGSEESLVIDSGTISILGQMWKLVVCLLLGRDNVAAGKNEHLRWLKQDSPKRSWTPDLEPLLNRWKRHTGDQIRRSLAARPSGFTQAIDSFQ